jgi:hypothetical protein
VDTTTDQQPAEDQEAPSRRSFRWLIGVGVGVVVAAGVLVWAAGIEDAPRKQDLSTPRGAAETFAQAAAAGDVDGVLAATCLGHDGCAEQHGGGATPAHLSEAKEVIVKNVREIGARFRQAEFTGTRAGAVAGTQEVDYRLPGMPEAERSYLVFVEYQNRWLYIGTGGPS